jgi:hypothetical protein
MGLDKGRGNQITRQLETLITLRAPSQRLLVLTDMMQEQSF